MVEPWWNRVEPSWNRRGTVVEPSMEPSMNWVPVSAPGGHLIFRGVVVGVAKANNETSKTTSQNVQKRTKTFENVEKRQKTCENVIQNVRKRIKTLKNESTKRAKTCENVEKC